MEECPSGRTFSLCRVYRTLSPDSGGAGQPADLEHCGRLCAAEKRRLTIQQPPSTPGGTPHQLADRARGIGSE